MATEQPPLKKTATKKEAKQEPISIVGEVEIRPLSDVRPNDWNPNEVPLHVMESIRHGFRTIGWLKSHSLLIWGTDDKGKVRNIIIDGEHRWQAGQDVGLEKGPMVFLHNLKESLARKLTVKLDQNRGAFNVNKLAQLIQSLGSELELPLELGFKKDEIDKLIKMETGSFLDRFKTGDPGPDGRVSKGEHHEYVTFAISLTPAQSDKLLMTLKKAKRRYNVRTNVDALLGMCGTFDAGE